MWCYRIEHPQRQRGQHVSMLMYKARAGATLEWNGMEWNGMEWNGME